MSGELASESVLLAGATGLVGSRVLDALVAAGTPVVAVTRRTTGKTAPQLTEIIVDFAALPVLPKADVAICALGTTIRAAGSQAAFRAVDYDAVLAFARVAKAAGVGRFILVSSVGANAASPVFYSRVKGEVERDVEALGFGRLDLIHPGLIIGMRADRRPMEAILQVVAPLLRPFLVGPLDTIGAIGAEVIAAAVVALAGEGAPGRFVHDNRDLMRSAKG